MQHISHYGFTETTAQFLNTAHNSASLQGYILRLIRPLAIGAIATLRSGFVPEIIQDMTAQTARSKTVACHSSQQATLRGTHQFALFRRKGLIFHFLLDKESARADIAVVPQQQTLRRLAVATSTTRFLVIRLQRTRHIVMDNVAHIRFVDAHAKRIGGHHDGSVIQHKRLLRIGALLNRKTRMVANRLHAGFHQCLMHLFDVFARGAIHNARVLRMIQSVRNNTRQLAL